MNISIKEIAIYAVIAIIVVAGVLIYFTYFSNPSVDLRISLAQKGVAASTLYPYQQVTYTVTANNTGSSQINNLYVAVYVNNQQQSSYSKNIIPLPKGTAAEYNITLIFSTNGTYNVQAVADPAKLLNIQNRSAAQSSVSVNVAPPQTPEVYTSIPNANITATQSFTLQKSALIPLLYIATGYNGTPMRNALGFGDILTTRIFENMLPSDVYIGKVNGAYAEYANGQRAYTAWIQGTINDTLLNTIVSSFGSQPAQFSSGSAPAYYSRINSTASLCYYYEQGWTKLIEFNNASLAGSSSCKSIASQRFNASENEKFVSALKNNTAVSEFTSAITYQNFTTSNTTGVNRTYIGTSLFLNGRSFAALNMTAGPPGYFFSYVTTNIPPLNLSKPRYCAGIPFFEQYESTCSEFVPPVKSTTNSSAVLVNTTELNSNYTMMLYSLVNTSTRFEAVLSGRQLFFGSNFSAEGSKWWNSTFMNRCTFPANVPLKCSVNYFLHTSAVANLTLTGTSTSPVYVKSLGCYTPYTGAAEINYSVAKTLSLNQSASVDIFCKGIQPGFNFIFTPLYTLDLAYNQSGRMVNATGTLNITN